MGFGERGPNKFFQVVIHADLKVAGSIRYVGLFVLLWQPENFSFI